MPALENWFAAIGIITVAVLSVALVVRGSLELVVFFNERSKKKRRSHRENK